MPMIPERDKRDKYGHNLFDKERLKAALKEIKPDNRKKEYYLTDTVSVLIKRVLGGERQVR